MLQPAKGTEQLQIKVYLKAYTYINVTTTPWLGNT